MFNNPLKKHQQGGQVSQEEQQMLAAFVDWLPKRVKEFQGMQPEQIVEALNGMSKSPEGQKQVQAYMQQFQKEMQNSKAGMFKEGGKLQDFICKHAKGGHVAGCGCKEDGGKVDGKFENYKMVQDTTKTNPDGSISQIKIIADPEGQAARQTITGKDTTSVGGYWLNNRFIPEGDSVFNNTELEMALQNLRSKATVQSEQEGGNLSRKDALVAAMEAYGFDKAQARRAYANAKHALRNSGLRGSALKQAAREMIAKRNNAPAEQPPQMESIPMEGTIAAIRPVAFAIQSQGDLRPIKSVGISGAPTRNYDNMTFNNAFRAARNIAQNGGDQTFMWRGKSYGTSLANPRDMRMADIDAMNHELFGNVSEGWMPPRDGSWRTAPVQTPYREKGGVVKGQEGLNIPAEPPTGYNGEIRQYIDRRNPIRRRIDNFVENNPYARKIVNLGKGIKESPLGMLLPDFSNGVAGAVAPAGKISNLGKALTKEEKLVDPRMLKTYREGHTAALRSDIEKYAGKAVDEGDDLVKVLDYEIPTNNNTYIDGYNLDLEPYPGFEQYIQEVDLNNLTKPVDHTMAWLVGGMGAGILAGVGGRALYDKYSKSKNTKK